ncbi:MAG: GNAT family N-acetyltransferase [Pseudomonadota bacterium]
MILDRLVPDRVRDLDRPAWAALSTRQQHLSQAFRSARAFDRRIAQFAATDPDARDPNADLAALIKERMEGVVLMQADAVPVCPCLRVQETFSGVQMIASRPVPEDNHSEIEPLAPPDLPGILTLVALAKPGPFKRQTLQTGAYVGVKANGHLIAMAGERMRLPGLTEISAVCVHPRHRGKGLARALTCYVARMIEDRGETPFLHTYATNHKAIALYGSLGFKLRSKMHITRVVARQH